jgi:hypothetical protein
MTGHQIIESTETQSRVGASVKPPVPLAVFVLDFCVVMDVYINLGVRLTNPANCGE